MKQWLKQSLLPEVGAISGEDIYENLIQIFDDFDKNGFILTLDYGKAFDSVDTRLSCQLLLRHGWPATIVKFLGSVRFGKISVGSFNGITTPTFNP